MKYIALLTFLLCTLIIHAQNRILVDGKFDDWENHPSAYDDVTGDGGTSGIDFDKVKIYNDADYIFFYLETGVEINLQDFNNVQIHLDVDNNTSTGTSSNGMGVDLTYTFGSRSGTYYNSTGSPISIKHIDIGMITAPTVTSDRFEIAIKRVFFIKGVPVSMADSVKVAFNDNASNGDELPANNGAIRYTFSSKNLEALPGYSMLKPETTNLRIVSYNVERDGFFEANRVPAYTRIFQAVQPDIIGFQEIYNHTSLQVANQLESILPSVTGEQWYHAMAEPDCHAISKYPIVKSAQIPGANGSGNGAFLIALPVPDSNLLLIVAHPPCCANNTARQMEVDQIMEFVREAKQGKGPIPIDTNTPIVIVGDMNFVGEHNQLTTLLTGDIFDEATYGSDFTPDWDGSNLLDSKPHTTGVPFSFTWYSESSAFSPGKLDYILYTGSNLKLDNTYTLYTPGLPQDSLNAYKMQSRDVVIASDHLPVVADFTLKKKSTNGILRAGQNWGSLEIYPNPSKSEIRFYGLQAGLVEHCTILDITGKNVIDMDNLLSDGNIDISKLTRGLYFVKLISSGQSYSGKFL
ncbi:MAG: endonuclease/exonuclease/phosphatase family metal-dependent hydrolase, partial [bacterium]